MRSPRVIDMGGGHIKKLGGSLKRATMLRHEYNNSQTQSVLGFSYSTLSSTGVVSSRHHTPYVVDSYDQIRVLATSAPFPTVIAFHKPVAKVWRRGIRSTEKLYRHSARSEDASQCL
jgi:hypothetical protein